MDKAVGAVLGPRELCKVTAEWRVSEALNDG